MRLLAHSARKARAKELLNKDKDKERENGEEDAKQTRQAVNCVDHLSPTRVACDIDAEIVKLASGGMHYMLLTVDGRVYVWGRGTDGQLGHGSTKELKTPSLLLVGEHESAATVVDIATGFDFSFAVDANNQLWAWGQNSESQLGLLKECAAGLPSRKEVKIKTSRREIRIARSNHVESHPTKVALPNSHECTQYYATESLNYSVDVLAMKRSTKAAKVDLLNEPATFQLKSGERLDVNNDTLSQTLIEYRADLDLAAVLKRCESLHAFQYAALIHEMRGELHYSLAMHLKAIDLTLAAETVRERVVAASSYVLQRVLHDSHGITALHVLFDFCIQHAPLIDLHTVLMDMYRREPLRKFVFGVLILQCIADKQQSLASNAPFLLDLLSVTLDLLHESNNPESLASAPVMQLIYSSEDQLLFPAERMWQNILKNITDSAQQLNLA